jgi:GR25 family glycosyltransferase involved in LPS biosynthesis
LDPTNTKLYEWAEEYVAQVNTADTSKWPTLASGPGSSSMGLKNVHIYVTSLEESVKRRDHFAKGFNALELSTELDAVHWLPGIPGKKAPDHLVSPNGAKAEHAEKEFHKMRGIFGCYFSHVLILKTHLQRCPTCDLMVFEDDIEFHPRFQEKWTTFFTSINKHPMAYYHLGGAVIRTTPAEIKQNHYMLKGPLDGTWGYIIRASAIQQIYDAITTNDYGSDRMGIDQQMGQGNLADIPVFAPRRPLVYSVFVSDEMPGDKSGDGVAEDLSAMKWEDRAFLPYWCSGPCANSNDR